MQTQLTPRSAPLELTAPAEAVRPKRRTATLVIIDMSIVLLLTVFMVIYVPLALQSTGTPHALFGDVPVQENVQEASTTPIPLDCATLSDTESESTSTP